MNPDFQIVLCAGAPDTPEIGAEMKAAVSQAQAKRKGIIWINEMVDKETVHQFYARRSSVARRSTNRLGLSISRRWPAKQPWWRCEARWNQGSCGRWRTGFLVSLEQNEREPFEATNPEKFERDLADRINQVMASPGLQRKFDAGRKRAEEKFVDPQSRGDEDS
jgi:hypothetical protein